MKTDLCYGSRLLVRLEFHLVQSNDRSGGFGATQVFHMQTLNSLKTSRFVGLALATSAMLLGGEAMAVTPITTSLTAPLSAIGGQGIDLTAPSRGFDPAWFNNATSYATDHDLSYVLKGGTLFLTEAASRVTFTLVGFEAGFINAFTAGGQTLRNPNLGASFSFENVAAGLLDFGFLSNGIGRPVGNGNASTSIVLADNNRSALIFFNDSYFGDNDYDDMVVQLAVTAVPEPETISMLLAGLGLMGFMARRRQRAA